MSLNWNEPVIEWACMLTKYTCALNRELLCFDIQTCVTKREQLWLTRAIMLKGSGRICHLYVISDDNLGGGGQRYFRPCTLYTLKIQKWP